MAKNNFKAKEAVNDANYAQGVGRAGAGAMDVGLGQEQQGYGALRDTLGQQKSFADMLQSAAAGTGGPTMADQQIKDATARNNANAAGFAAGAKGLNPALAARQALMAQAGNNQQAAGQAAQTRVQEQLAAREQLGGALAGEAGTAGGMTSAGQGLFGTGGSLANQSNQNLISSRNSANQINADVSKQNTGILNGVIGGVTGAIGKGLTMGLAEGGVVPGEPEGTQNDETSIALAKGGAVPAMPALHTSMPHAAGPMPHRSFAAQVAHHLSREYFAEGGEAHGSYDFPAMDLRSAKPKPKPKPQTESGASTTMFIPHDYHPNDTPSQAQHEGDDSEGKPTRKLKLNQGGYAQPEDHSEEDYNPADDDPEADNEPDTDVATDPDEAEEHGIPRYAEGGEADESAGMDTSHRVLDAVAADNPDLHPSTQEHPSAFARIGSALSGFSQGFKGGEGSAVPSMVSAGPSVAQRQASGPQGPNGPPRISTRIPVKEPYSNVPAPLMGDRSGAPFTVRVPPPGGGAVASYDAGGPVPGKANVQGDSLKNDVVDAKLSPGEVVLPRSISHDPEKAKKFVEHLMQHGGSGHDALSAIKKRKS